MSNNNKKPIAKNPLAALNLTEAVHNITHSGENDTKTKVKSEKQEKVVKEKVTDKPASSKKTYSKDMTDSIIDGCIAFDRTSDKGKAVQIPASLLDGLKKFSEKYNRRLSVRTMISALINTFINDYDGEEVIDKFMERVHYVQPSEEELKARKKAAAKAKAMRKAAKNYNKEDNL